MDLIHELPAFLAIALVACALTLAVSVTLGRRIARRTRFLAIVICSLFWPIAPFIWVGIGQWSDPGPPPPNDGPAMAILGALLLAVISFPFALVTSCIVMLRTHPRRSGR